MANKDTPVGFEPFGPVMQSHSFVAGSRVFQGDAVILASDGKCDPIAAGNDIYGVALSYADADGDKFLCSIDPEQLYKIQASATEVNAQTDVGNNADVLATAGNTTYNRSRQELDSTTLATSAAQLFIVDIDQRNDNEFATGNVDVIVQIQEHQFFGENDGAGI